MTSNKELSVVFLDAATLSRGDVSLDGFTSRWNCVFHEVTTPAETADRITGFDIVVTNKVVINAELMVSEAASSLKLVSIAATGTNNVDLEAARANGVAVCNVAGYSTNSVVQHTMNFILEFASHIGGYAGDIRRGAWENSPTFTMLTRPCFELNGKTIGIIGYGTIGKSVATVAEAFGMKAIIATRPGTTGPVPEGRVSLDTLLKTADFVSIHCPLTPETKNLIDARAMSIMKPGAFIINAGRGGIVDEIALVDALRNGRIAGAATDVLTAEPPAADHPLIIAAKELDNLLISPHTAWSTLEARQRLLDEMTENVLAFIEGKPRNRVA